MFQIFERDYIKVGEFYWKQLNKSTKETNRDCIALIYTKAMVQEDVKQPIQYKYLGSR